MTKYHWVFEITFFIPTMMEEPYVGVFKSIREMAKFHKMSYYFLSNAFNKDHFNQFSQDFCSIRQYCISEQNRELVANNKTITIKPARI